MITGRFTRKLVMIFGTISLLVALVLVASGLSGMAAQSVSAGVLFPIENALLLAVCVAVGLASAQWLRGEEAVALPLGFLFLLAASVGAALDYVATQTAVSAAALVVMAAGLAYGARMMAGVVVLGVVAVLVVFSLSFPEQIATQPVYLMFGIALSCLIVMASSMSIVVAMRGVDTPYPQRAPSPVVYFPRLSVR